MACRNQKLLDFFFNKKSLHCFGHAFLSKQCGFWVDLLPRLRRFKWLFRVENYIYLSRILDKFCFVNHISPLINLVIFLCTRDVGVKISDYNLPSWNCNGHSCSAKCRHPVSQRASINWRKEFRLRTSLSISSCAALMEPWFVSSHFIFSLSLFVRQGR